MGTLSGIGAKIVCKGNEKEACVDQCDNADSDITDVGEYNHYDQRGEQHCGAHLSGDQRAFQNIPAICGQNSGDQLKQLFYKEQDRYRPQNGVAQSQTDEQSELGNLICQRIQELAESSDHIKFSCDFAVYHIRQTGDGQNGACDDIITGLICFDINHHIYGNQDQPEKAKEIRYGEYFFFPVFDEHPSASEIVP